jgi:hypothetical protein
MKEKIVLFLKTKLNGVQESYLQGVAEHYSKTVTDEKQIETTFTDGVIDLLKLNASLLQAEGDKRATEAQKTALKNFQEKHGLDENGKLIDDPSKRGPGRPKKDVEPDPDEPKWFTAYKKEQQEATEKLTAEIEKQKQEKTLASLAEKVSKHEKLKDIPASYLKGRNLIPKSEAEIDQLAASIETDYNGFKQEMAEKGVVISVPPAGGGQQGEKVTINDYLDEKFPKEPQGNVLTKK